MLIQILEICKIVSFETRDMNPADAFKGGLK